MAVDLGALRRALRTYRGAGLTTRAFLAARVAVAPLGPLEPELRGLRGRVLSVGVGHGAVDRYVAELNPDVEIDGTDLDGARIELARRTQERSPRVRFAVADVTTMDPGAGYDHAMAIDVLHHVPADAHGTIAGAVLRALKPGGTFLVKEMASEPRRQYLWNRFHDRIVAGPEPLACRLPEEMAGVLRGAGFEIVEQRRLRRLRIYPQYLVVGRRPA